MVSPRTLARSLDSAIDRLRAIKDVQRAVDMVDSVLGRGQRLTLSEEQINALLDLADSLNSFISNPLRTADEFDSAIHKARSALRSN